MPDSYLQRILNREAVDTGTDSPVRSVLNTLNPMIREWAGHLLLNVSPSGSFAKGTANKSGTDIDLFISISENCTDTLRELYDKLYQKMSSSGYTPRKQNVSINVKVKSYDVDLVPAKRQRAYGDDHSLYRRKANTWIKTNVVTHIAHVRDGGRIAESRILKLWRNQKSLDFPSFYLELTVINALAGQHGGGLSDRVLQVFQYLRGSFASARVVDPANTNNIISDDLSTSERAAVKAAAERALAAKDWSEIVR